MMSDQATHRFSRAPGLLRGAVHRALAAIESGTVVLSEP